jgi:hypothetical protein
LELNAGIIEGDWTPLAVKQASWAVAHLPPKESEEACKTLATQRLKRSGMRWRQAGGQAILTFRSLCQSDRFERAWELLATTYKRPVGLPRKVIALSDHRERG